MVSLKDIASECQVSIATVSKALNDQGDISEATKNRISRIAKEMGYQANPIAISLANKRTKQIVHFLKDKKIVLMKRRLKN